MNPETRSQFDRSVKLMLKIPRFAEAAPKMYGELIHYIMTGSRALSRTAYSSAYTNEWEALKFLDAWRATQTFLSHTFYFMTDPLRRPDYMTRGATEFRIWVNENREFLKSLKAL